MQSHSVINAPSKRKKLMTEIWKNREIYLLIIPAVIWYIVMCYFPMGGLSLAFKSYKGKLGIWGSPWIGLKNFQSVFKSPMFSDAFWMTIWINIVMLAICFPAPIILALMLNELRMNRYKKALQTIFTFPNFLSWIIISSIIKNLLSSDGALNGFLATLGMGPVSILGEKELFRPLIYFTSIWKSAGWSSIIYLATISGIDNEMYEAALIDGATKWQQTKYITIPLLKPVIIIMFIMAVGKIFNSDFGLFYQATRNSGALVDITQTIDVYVYKALLERPNINMSSASSLLQSVCGCITIVAANLVVKKIDPDAGMF